jgi:adenylate cyclase
MNPASWKPRIHLVLGLVLAVGLGGGVYALWRIGVLERAEQHMIDVRFRLRGARPSASRDLIVICGIDSRTLDQARQAGLRAAPLDRRVYARAIANMAEAGANLICMDVLLSFGRDPAEDKALVSAVGEAGCVLLARTVERGQWLDPIDALQAEDAMLDMGHVVVETDDDEILRRLDKTVILTLDPDKQPVWVPSLALQAVLYYEPPSAQSAPAEGGPATDPHVRMDPPGPIEIRDHVIPRSFYVNYIGPLSPEPDGRTGFKHVSLWDVAAGRTPARVFEDKIVLVGSTRYGVDAFATPYSARVTRTNADTGLVEERYMLMPGVEFHANVITTILDNKHIRRMGRTLGDSGMAVVLGLLALAGFVLFFPLRLGLWIKAPAVVSGLAVLGLGAHRAFAASDYLVEVMPLVVLWCLEFVVGVAVQVMLLRQRNRQIRHVFGRYVSPDVLKKILANPEALDMAEEKQVTVLFSDIRSFTAMSERMAPAEVIALLNEYFEYMVAAIFEAGGSVDKFVGDEIMAVFGAPFELADHPKHAVRTALAMQEAVREFNRQRAERGLDPIQMGVGIHTGPVVAGTVGAHQRVEYSVIGDTVNTAARIESQTTGFQILVSRAVYDAVAEEVEARPLPPVAVKGKSEPLEIFEVTGMK